VNSARLKEEDVMKRLGLVLLLVAALFVPAAQAGEIIIATGDRVIVTTGPAGLSGSPYWIDGPGTLDFYSFCLELDEHIFSGTEYYVKLSDAADPGGVGGGSPDPLSSETAYLYSRFRSGAIALPTLDDWWGLQLAIWRLEDEVDVTYGGRGTAVARIAADAFYADAMAKKDGSLYDVAVMQLWGDRSFTEGYQDMLTTVPDGGATLMLLGAALMGLGAVRRKFRQ
jgi:hypothetical protein